MKKISASTIRAFIMAAFDQQEASLRKLPNLTNGIDRCAPWWGRVEALLVLAYDSGKGWKAWVWCGVVVIVGGMSAEG